MRITLIKPDDWHLHLRDDEAMNSVVTHSAERFGRAIVMPNLKPPITDTNMAIGYRKRILDALPDDTGFTPLMTLYMTDRLTSEEVKVAKQSGVVHGIKLYPAGATTNSDAGVTDIHALYPVLETMQKEAMPLLVHAEVTDQQVDIFDREKVFIDQHLAPLREEFPGLAMVFEHVTTRDAVDFVMSCKEPTGATITPQHLMFNRNHMLAGGIKPHYYCLPILKRESHQEALINAAISGDPRFFLGTDSAPHPQHAKECACGCAGCYTAHAAIELYAEIFEAENALDKLEGFASLHGAEFYGLPPNQQKITLEKADWEAPESYRFGEDRVVPLRAGQQIGWRLVSD